LTIETSAHYQGYARIELEKLDPSKPGDAQESFNLGRERAADDPELLAGTPFVGTNRWPDVPGFRATMLRYFEALTHVGLAVHRAIANRRGEAKTLNNLGSSRNTWGVTPRRCGRTSRRCRFFERSGIDSAKRATKITSASSMKISAAIYRRLRPTNRP